MWCEVAPLLSWRPSLRTGTGRCPVISAGAQPLQGEKVSERFHPVPDGIFPLKAMTSGRRGDYSNAQSTFLTHEFCRLTAASATPTEVPWSISWNLKKNRLVARWKRGGSPEGLDAPARKQTECTTEAISTEPPSTHLSSITAKRTRTSRPSSSPTET